MSTESEQLDRDALLMLYAADELPQEQIIALEAQLAADPSLAADLQRVRDLMTHADDTVRAMDEVQRPPVSSAVAVRRAARAMQQWGVDRMRTRIEPEKKTVHMPWWIYPTAAAAIIIVAFLIWSGKQEIHGLPPLSDNSNAVADDRTPATNETDELASSLVKTFELENSSVALVVDDSAKTPTTSVSVASDSMDDSGAFFLSPRVEREEIAQ